MIDICDTFGPLAAMHAALDRAGAGMPCGLAARFPNCGESELETAVARARCLYPILQTRLIWRHGRPILERQVPTPRQNDAGPLLDFTSGEDGRTWSHRLIRVGDDVWLQAVWGHALADGLSMLRFLEAVSAEMGGSPHAEYERPQREPARQQPFLAWFPRFLREQRGNYVSMPERRSASPDVSWLIASPRDRDRVLDAGAMACGGMLGWLAAAAAKAFAETREQPNGEVLLNVPIQRSALAQTSGFGFGVGSLRFPVRLDAGGTMELLADRIMRRMKTLGEAGWDRNLERLLSRNPSRHRRFAAIEAKRPPDPNLTVSWKGLHDRIGADNGPKDVACFAAAPTLHVSAHADANGLSVSVTSRQSEQDRRRLLERIAEHLGCAPGYSVHDLTPAGAVSEKLLDGTGRANAFV